MYYEDSLEPGPGDRLPEQTESAKVPPKFVDPATGEVRIEALAKAYQELERRLGSLPPRPVVPSSHEEYCIECRHPMLSNDPELNRRLHQAGFTQEQAQLVYDLAHERVVPAFQHFAEEYESRHHLKRLADHFGGDGKWNETARQLAAWGQSNLPPEVYETLSSSAEGIIAMRHMMSSGEPGLGAVPAMHEDEPTEEDLKKMMQDKRYWKKRDPAFIEKVSAGFRRLHGE